MADDSLRNYGAAAPHGPNMTGEHTATANISQMNANERDIFNHLILPDDSYNAEGEYWGDMSIPKRIGFVTKTDNAEAKRELRNIWAMTKRDPLSPVGYYLKNMVLPGAGLLLEGYVLFSIGNLQPLFAAVFPTCWGKASATNQLVCSENWIAAVTYLEIIGIMIGQVSVGLIGDYLGRRFGLIQDASIMLLGLVMLTAMWGTTFNGWVICYAWSLFIYGVGVGGEYPMTATSGMENAVGAGKVSTREDRLHRGRKVTSAFLMQGWGQVFNIVILILSLLIFHGGGNPPYNETIAQYIFRVSFAVPAVGTLWLVYYRVFKMRHAGAQLAAAKKRSHVTGYDAASLKLTFSVFGSRVFATAAGWFANDVFFYGNKLFAGQFIKVVANPNSLIVQWNYAFLNAGVQLVGYYLASFLIDNKLYGRKWMQIIGFIANFILFTVPAFNYGYYSTQGIKAFQAMYYLSSFFNQFGPNCVTFLVAAEVYPTSIRATAHGFSAAWGKAGALLAAVLYNYISVQTRFYFVPWFGLAGGFITLFFLPDTTGLDLKEQERRWRCIREGRAEEYHGVAVHPKHLSWWERFRGIGKNYNPQLDYEQKVQELRGEWENWQARKAAENPNDPVEDAEFDDDLASFFTRTEGSVRGEKAPVDVQQRSADASSDEDGKKQ